MKKLTEIFTGQQKTRLKEGSINLISTKEAAKIIGVSQRRIQQFVQEGRIKADKVGGVWLVDPKDLDKVRNLKNGRPKNAPKKI